MGNHETMETKQWIRGIIVLSIKTPPPNSLTVWEDSLFLLLFLDFSLARQAHPGIAVNAAHHTRREIVKLQCQKAGYS